MNYPPIQEVPVIVLSGIGTKLLVIFNGWMDGWIICLSTVEQKTIHNVQKCLRRNIWISFVCILEKSKSSALWNPGWHSVRPRVSLSCLFTEETHTVSAKTPKKHLAQLFVTCEHVHSSRSYERLLQYVWLYHFSPQPYYPLPARPASLGRRTSVSTPHEQSVGSSLSRFFSPGSIILHTVRDVHDPF